MAGVTQRSSAVIFVALLVLSTSSSLFFSDESRDTEGLSLSPEWVQFDVKEGVYFDAEGVLDEHLVDEERAPLAVGPFGTFDSNGLQLARPVPSSLLEPRLDLLLVLVSNDLRLQDVRQDMATIDGLAVREYIAPSGLLVQGTPLALQQAERHPALLASHAVPIGMLVDGPLLDLVLLAEGESVLQEMLLRLDGWRDDIGPIETVDLVDQDDGRLTQSLGDVARQAMVGRGPGTRAVTRGCCATSLSSRC